MLRYLPPAGAPIKIGHLVRALGQALSTGGSAPAIPPRVAGFFGVTHIFGASSGRVALEVLLTALHQLRPDRNVVAVPAYTCYSVPASVARAGLKLQPVDVNSKTLDYDFHALEALSEAGLLCVLTSNLFGLPSDASRAARIAHAKGAFLIDDAAQAMGAVRDGRQAGTAGNAGLFSLGRGKALAAGGGGLAVTSDESLAHAIRVQFAKLPSASFASTPAGFLENLAITVLLRPGLYWIPNSLPLLKLGVTEFDPHFSLRSMSRFTAALLGQVIPSLATLNQVRLRNAQLILSSLPESSGFRALESATGSSPIYLRLPLLASDAGLRDRALARLQAAGIGASPYYPAAVCDIPGIEPYLAEPRAHFPCAESVASRILTLPTHPLVEPGDVERMVEILSVSSREANSAPLRAQTRTSTALAGRE